MTLLAVLGSVATPVDGGVRQQEREGLETQVHEYVPDNAHRIESPEVCGKAFNRDLATRQRFDTRGSAEQLRLQTFSRPPAIRSKLSNLASVTEDCSCSVSWSFLFPLSAYKCRRRSFRISGAFVRTPILAGAVGRAEPEAIGEGRVEPRNVSPIFNQVIALFVLRCGR